MKIVLKVAYDGSAFTGFQRQPGHNTVQGTLESVLSQILTHPVTLQGAGRTDLGVHATGQVVAFSSDQVKNLARLCHSVNSVLREPLAVLEAVMLDPNDPFHPRYDAVARTYSYFILDGCGPREMGFWSGRAWCVPGTLDLALAERAANGFIGERDFSTFSYRMQEMATCVRCVSHLSIKAEAAPSLVSPQSGPRVIRLTITANGFLRRMVRLIAAGVVEVGLGQRSLKNLQDKLSTRDPARAPHPAPPGGLYLERIDYNLDPFTRYHGTPRHAVAKLKSRHRIKP